MDNEERKINQIEHELVKAFLNRDIKTLDRILADEFIITDPNRPSCTKQRYLAELEADRVSFKSLVIDEIKVRVIEGSAVVTGKATADGRSLEGPYTGQYSFMDVYIRKDSNWQAILSIVNRA
jgi:ketosteroid isomerase-like protein